MKRALRLGLAAVVLIGAAEGALRLYGFGRGIRFRPHPLLGWEMVPEQHAFNVRGRVPVRVNRLGFRGPEVAEVKPANGLRILFIGDGTTINNQTAEDATFPFLVQSSLQVKHTDRQVEALVGGVSGYQLEQDLGLLRLRAPVVHPDIVVIGFCWNDWARDTMRGGDLGPEAHGEYAGDATSLERTAIADFWTRLGRIRARRQQSRAHSHGEELPASSQHDVIWNHVSSTLDSINATCGRDSAQLVLLVLPAQMTRHDPEAFARRTRELAEWAARRGVLFVDPDSAFREAEASGASLYLDELHLGVDAQPLVATALVQALESNYKPLAERHP